MLRAMLIFFTFVSGTAMADKFECDLLVGHMTFEKKVTRGKVIQKAWTRRTIEDWPALCENVKAKKEKEYLEKYDIDPNSPYFIALCPTPTGGRIIYSLYILSEYNAVIRHQGTWDHDNACWGLD